MYSNLVQKAVQPNTALYTISAISCGEYCFKGHELAIAHNLYFSILMYGMTSGTCSFLDVMVRVMQNSDSLFLIHAKPPSPNMLHFQKPLAWHTQTTCLIDVMMVFFCLVPYQFSSPKVYFFDVLIINRILLIAIFLTVIVMFLCLSSIF